MCLPGKIPKQHLRRCFSVDLTLTLFCLAFISWSMQAQTSNENFPVQFNQFMFCYPLMNSAAMGIENNRDVLSGYQKPVTGFTGLDAYYFQFNFSPFRTKAGIANNKSSIGARFYSENEGAYINRIRVYGLYAFHTPLSGKLNFSGGIGLGVMNFSVKSTPTTPGASVLKPDADAGIWIYNDRYHTGISINQVFGSVFRPLDETTILPVYINLNASLIILKNDFLIVRPSVMFIYPHYSGRSINAALSGLLFDRIITVLSWKLQSNASVMLGVNDLAIGKANMNTVLSYTFSTKKSALSINMLEISLSISM